MLNQFNIEHAYPGLCSLCHREIAAFDGSYEVQDGITRPRITRILGIARTAIIHLDDRSTMTVALCKTCFNALKPEDMQELMESEINGWQKEVDHAAIGFDKAAKIRYMKKYSKRYATGRKDKPWTGDQKKKIKKPRKGKLKIKTK